MADQLEKITKSKLADYSRALGKTFNRVKASTGKKLSKIILNHCLVDDVCGSWNDPNSA